jgi:hypothetical protein
MFSILARYYLQSAALSWCLLSVGYCCSNDDAVAEQRWRQSWQMRAEISDQGGGGTVSFLKPALARAAPPSSPIKTKSPFALKTLALKH